MLATVFVTFPFVARELIPLMQARGHGGGGSGARAGRRRGWQMFWRVTLPNIKWGLLYGVILCNARAMGEFGAVSVVSGHIRGKTNTLPLHVEILYNEYNFQAAFAVASLLAFLALVTLVAKTLGRVARRREHRAPHAEDPHVALKSADVTKTFGVVRGASNDVSLHRARRASWWRCSAPRARARRACCASSPGLERADRGQVLFEGEDATVRDVRHRGVGFVFQHYALFRHMTVFENVAFGLRVRPRARRARRRARSAARSRTC